MAVCVCAYCCGLVCVAHPILTSVFICKGERLQVVEIPRKREKSKVKKNTVVFKLIIGSLERS